MSYIEETPTEIWCNTLRRLPLAQIMQLVADERWRSVVETCPSVVANRQEAIQLPLETLRAWRWTRRIRYVFTTFPPDSRQWPALLEELKAQPVLAIEIVSENPMAPEALVSSIVPLPGTKRIVVVPREGGGYRAATVEIYEGQRYEVSAFDPIVRSSTSNGGLRTRAHPRRA